MSPATATSTFIHRDETNVHIHVCFVPVYEYGDRNGRQKCSVSQTKFFTSPKALASMHRKLRKSFKDKGYDAEMENKPVDEHLAGYYDKQGNWHQQGLTPDQLKELTEKQIQLRLEGMRMRFRQEELSNLEKAMKELQVSAENRKTQPEHERQLLERQKAVLRQGQTSVQAQLRAIELERASVQEMKRQAEEMLTKAQDTADVCREIIQEKKHLNTKFLEFCGREGERTRRDIRGFVERLYKEFQKERRDSRSSWQLEMLRDRELRRQENGETAHRDEPNIIDTGVSDFSFM